MLAIYYFSAYRNIGIPERQEIGCGDITNRAAGQKAAKTRPDSVYEYSAGPGSFAGFKGEVLIRPFFLARIRLLTDAIDNLHELAVIGDATACPGVAVTPDGSHIVTGSTIKRHGCRRR